MEEELKIGDTVYTSKYSDISFSKIVSETKAYFVLSNKQMIRKKNGMVRGTGSDGSRFSCFNTIYYQKASDELIKDEAMKKKCKKVWLILRDYFQNLKIDDSNINKYEELARTLEIDLTINSTLNK